MMRRTFVKAAVALAATVGLIVGTAGTALANDPDNWSSNRMLCQWSKCVKDSYLTMFWQSILWADNVGGVDVSTIDGQFGPNTHTRTERWQTRHGLQADGEVGPNTWGKAENNGRWVYAGMQGNNQLYEYRGLARTVRSKILEGGLWIFENPKDKVWYGLNSW